MKGEADIAQTTGSSTDAVMSQDAATKSFALKGDLLFSGEVILDQSRTISVEDTSRYTHFVADMTFVVNSAGDKGSVLICNAPNESTYILGLRSPAAPDYHVGGVTVNPASVVFSQARSAKFSATTAPVAVTYVRLNRLIGIRLW